MASPHTRTPRPLVTFAPDAGVGVYLRKSSDRQGDLSLPAQERVINERIVVPSKLPIFRVYRDILSGRTPNRSDYQQLLADARAGKLRMVTFHKVNRFGRNAAEGLLAIEELRRLGVEVRVADMPSLDITTPAGMFVFTFLLGQGQYEVENLATEANKGMLELARRGGWPFKAPDGYLNCHEEIGHRKYRCWVAINRPRAALLRLIYRWYDRGDLSLLRLAQRLNTLHDRRIAAGKSACLTPRGKRWMSQYLHHILTNRFYTGDIVIPRWHIAQPGVHKPIIGQAQFARVQARLAANSPGALEIHGYPLQGLLVFENGQGARCTTIRRGERLHRYYYRLRPSGQRQHYPADPIEQQVAAAITRAVAGLGAAPEQTLRRQVRRHLTTLRDDAQTRLATLAEERQRVLRFAAKGRFSEAEIEGELLRIGCDIDQARWDEEQALLLNTMHDQLVAEAAVQIGVVQCWSTYSPTEQCAAIKTMLRVVVMDTEGAIVRLTWHALWDMLLFPQHYGGSEVATSV